MAQGTSAGLLKILGQVSVIVVIPILGGTVTGIILDRVLGSSPLLVLSGFGAGNVVAILGVWVYIRTQLRRMSNRADRHDEG
ncbi:MAG: AtpZ/AtpI family protein [Chloroflexota bacterium]|nr:AtpZ/AtpI family protein [Chloroflexota bacterium]